MRKSTEDRKLGFLGMLNTVFWSFFGVRKGRDHARDLARINPVHLIATAIFCGAVFIGVLIFVVKMVTR